jgi:hypothetical protein
MKAIGELPDIHLDRNFPVSDDRAPLSHAAKNYTPPAIFLK